ncbi:hypothetical protein TNCT_701561 [Trichonephila clavata]|uniref:Uncharacterized protein n=1 Tax=Trichonephila clavata TaxID=2740835 RepID=A0A8X6H3S9_TRICU|nr:hypothetical protein TNCT_701561 [Trichonephila clavata]
MLDCMILSIARMQLTSCPSQQRHLTSLLFMCEALIKHAMKPHAHIVKKLRFAADSAEQEISQYNINILHGSTADPLFRGRCSCLWKPE